MTTFFFKYNSIIKRDTSFLDSGEVFVPDVVESESINNKGFDCCLMNISESLDISSKNPHHELRLFGNNGVFVLSINNGAKSDYPVITIP